MVDVAVPLERFYKPDLDAAQHARLQASPSIFLMVV